MLLYLHHVCDKVKLILWAIEGNKQHLSICLKVVTATVFAIALHSKIHTEFCSGGSNNFG